jgi:putative transposase
MPRKGRAVLPGYPHHVVQRGHDRNVVFVEDDDYRYYIDTLSEWSMAFGIRVHAYCLMTNHVHLLLEPETASGLGALMKRLAGRQTRYRNRLERRSGTLWEGRYKSSIVDGEHYLGACIRYIEMNPVRALMVIDPLDYPWSSCRVHAGSESKSWLAPVDGTVGDYAEFLRGGLGDEQLTLIREAVNRSQLTGDTRFVDEVEAALGRRIERRGPGGQVKRRIE